ncbi:glycosyltransferase family 1 protein, partial [Bacillus sp. SIMBA_074]
RKVAQLPAHEQEQYSLDCVLPFQFRNGMGGFTFQHVQFFKSNHPIDDIIRRDQKKRYDYIFIRGRNEAIKLLDKRPA